MELIMREHQRGITAELTLKISSQVSAYPDAISQSCAMHLLEQGQEMDQCLDGAHIELLALLRQARLAAERSLVQFSAQSLHEQIQESNALAQPTERR